VSDDRTRSYWGWGYVEEHPDEDEVQALRERLETEFGFPELDLVDAPDLADVEVPDPEIEAPAHLDFCTQEKRSRVHHTYGDGYRDKVLGVRGDFDAAPDIVARPESEDDVADLLEWASDERVAVIPYGGGTSVARGIEAEVGGGFAGVVTLDTREMDAILEIDEESRRARIQAGALGPQIQDGLAEHGYQLRHYPQSYEFSTLGGWIATHAGGHFATEYTHIDDFVESARMVTPSGTVETQQVPRSGAGPKSNHFMLGSEGSLGVITEAWMNVQPRPEARSRATVRFSDWEGAVDAIREIAQARLSPANCRLLDRNESTLFELADHDDHLLFLGFESLAGAGSTRENLSEALSMCETHGGECPRGPIHGDRESDEETPEDRWRSAFIEAPYVWDEFVRLGVIFATFETSITWDRFDDFHADIYEGVTAAMDDACGTGHVSCRFTHVYPDGPAPYYTFMAPAERGRELEQWRQIKQTAGDIIDDHGATITHHHAVGRLHQQWYERETADFQATLRAMKGALDPAGIMNPGVLVDDTE
jgi:alkyldihydroxyacetonephosphate synthase